MCRKLICLIGLMAVFAFVGTAQAASTLTNGGFEEPNSLVGGVEYWPGWTQIYPVGATGVWTWGVGTAHIITTDKYAGLKCADFYSVGPWVGGAGVFHQVLVEAGVPVSISAYAKNVSITIPATCGIDMVFFNVIPDETTKNPPNIGRVDLPLTGTVTHTGYTGPNSGSWGAADGQGWQYGILNAVTPAGTKCMKFEVNNNNGGGHIRFDTVVGTMGTNKAWLPYPFDGCVYGGADVTLTWAPGDNAVKHDVYFDTDFADVNTATRASHPGLLHYSENQQNTNYPITGLIPGTKYYWRIDEVNDNAWAPAGSPWKGRVWSLTVQSAVAYEPSPPDKDILVDPNVNLSWSVGLYAAKVNGHKVYLDTTKAKVDTRTGCQINGVSRTEPNYIIGTLLDMNDTYYWAVDEVNGPNSWPGPVWSFTTWPEWPITDPTLVGWWKLDKSDEGTGKARDWSGYNHHGTLMGDPNYVTGKVGDAINLDGVDDFVSVGSVGISGAAPRTIAGWAKMNTTTIPAWTNVFGFQGSANFSFFDIVVSGTNAPPLLGGWYVIHIYYWQQPILPPDLEWHHFAATYDGTTICWYGDGSLITQADHTLNTTDNVQIGRSTTYFPGLIDDVRIYNRALTPTEISNMAASPKATVPNPENNATEVDKNPTLTWKPGIYAAAANGHHVYFGNVFSDVNQGIGDANKGLKTPPSYTPPGPLNDPKLVSPETYYWRVDEVNGVTTWPGNVWSFTVPIYKVVDNFELYPKTGTQDLENSPTNAGYPIVPAGSLRRTWIDGLWTVEWAAPPLPPPPLVPTVATSGSYVQLNTDPNDGNTPNWVLYNNRNTTQGGTKSMKFYYDNDGSISWVNDLRLPIDIAGGQSYGSVWNYTTPNYYSEASAAVDDAARSYPDDQNSLGMLRNWSGYKLLKLSYYGDPNNTVNVATDKLYVGLKDGDGTEVTLYHSDSDPNIKLLGWHDWYIRLKDFNTPPTGTSAMNLTDVNRIYIGIGTRGNTTTKGGKGAVFFDDIRLYPVSVCIPGTVAGDFNGDCKVDGNDLQRMSQIWLGQVSTQTPVINLDATSLNQALGSPVTTWSFTGTNPGSFVDFNTPQTGYRPKVQMVGGVKAVVFDGNDIMKATINAPASITGTNPFTVIYKVWERDIGLGDRVFAWAKRGGTVYGRFADVGYGTATTYGAVGHGSVGTNDPNYDMGFAGGVPAAATWHTIAVTYPGGPNSIQTLVVDGVVNATKVMTLDIWPSCPMTIGSCYDGNSTDPNVKITADTGNFYTGAMSSLKVYGVAISPKDLAVMTGTPIDMKVDNVINFKDLALFAKKWMVGPVLFP
jgi:hypothetical protein